MNRFKVKNQNLGKKIVQIYKDLINKFSNLALSKMIYNLEDLQLLTNDEDNVMEITTKELIRRLNGNSFEISILSSIIKTLSKAMYLDPTDEFFKTMTSILESNEELINGQNAVVFLIFFYKHACDEPKAIKILFERIKSNISEIQFFEAISIIRSIAFFQYYDSELWKLIESKFFEFKETFIKKLTEDVTLMSQLIFGLHAIIVEKPDLIQNKEALLNDYNSLREISLRKIQTPIVFHNPLQILGRFSVFHLLKAIGLNPIPEKIIDIFNVDLFIPEISKKKIEEIKENIDLENICDNLYNDKIFEDQEKFFHELKKAREEAMNKEIPINKENSLLIEIHGRQHFLKTEDFLNGSSILKARLVRKSGYNLMILTNKECLQFRDKFSKREIILDILQKLQEYAK